MIAHVARNLARHRLPRRSRSLAISATSTWFADIAAPPPSSSSASFRKEARPGDEATGRELDRVGQRRSGRLGRDVLPEPLLGEALEGAVGMHVGDDAVEEREQAAVFGPLLSSANATETVKIGGPSRTRIGAPALTASARPLLLATIASYLRPALTAWMHSLSVGSEVTCGSSVPGRCSGRRSRACRSATARRSSRYRRRRLAVIELGERLDRGIDRDRDGTGVVVVRIGEVDDLGATDGHAHRADRDVPAAAPAAGRDGVPAGGLPVEPMSLPSLADRRLTVSSAVEVSKPSYLPVSTLRNENGL